MSSWIGRAAAAVGVIATFAVAAPAQAHHISTCPGLSDPACNVEYFKAHQVDPYTDPVLVRIGCFRKPTITVSCVLSVAPEVWQTLETLDTLVRDASKQVEDATRPYSEMVYQEVMRIYGQAEAEAWAALCLYFGACR